MRGFFTGATRSDRAIVSVWLLALVAGIAVSNWAACLAVVALLLSRGEVHRLQASRQQPGEENPSQGGTE